MPTILYQLAGGDVAELEDHSIEEEARYNFGYVQMVSHLLQYYGLDHVCRRIGKKHRLGYNLESVLGLLLIERLSDPCSKRASYFHQGEYFGLEAISLQWLYRSLDKLDQYSTTIEEHIFAKGRHLFDQGLDLVFYDVTTLYFDSEIEAEGALRQKGFSKDGKIGKTQLVLGLLIDRHKQPVAYHIFAGNTFEGHTLKTVLEDLKKRYQLDRIVVVADRAMLSKANIELVAEQLGLSYYLSPYRVKLKSLVFQEEDQDGEPRITLLEMIRQFGKNQLSEEENRQYSKIFCEHFLSIVTKAQKHLAGSTQTDWLRVLEKENSNLRAVYDWLVTQENDLEAGVQLVKGLYRFWLIRGPSASEGLNKILQVIERLERSDQPSEELAQLYSYAATFSQGPGLYLQAKDFYERSLDIYRRLNDQPGIAVTLNHLGWMDWRLGNFEMAKQRSIEGLKLHKELINPSSIATSLNNLGAAAHNQGDFEASRDFHREALTIRKQFSDPRAIAFSKLGLGQALCYCGAFSEAKKTLENALKIFESLTDNPLMGYTLNVLADLEYRTNNLENARHLIEERSLPIERQLGSRFGLGFALRVLGDVYLAFDNYELAQKYHYESNDHREKSNDTWCIAQSLHRLARVASKTGNLSTAQKNLHQSLRLRTRMKDKHGVLECLEFCINLADQQEDYAWASQLLVASEYFRNQYQVPMAPIESKQREVTLNSIRNDLNNVSSASDQLEGSHEDIWAFAQEAIDKLASIS